MHFTLFPNLSLRPSWVEPLSLMSFGQSKGEEYYRVYNVNVKSVRFMFSYVSTVLLI